MKVEAVETRTLVLKPDRPIGSALGKLTAFACILVTVRGEGVFGENVVFTLNDRRTRVLRAQIEEMADIVIGHDAGQMAGFWKRAWRDTNFLGHKGVAIAGISALDGALWDMFGKACVQPLYRILGGASDRVATYHSGGLWLDRSIDELVAEALRYKQEGFTAMKMRLSGQDHDTDIARVKAVREAIGPKTKLMADANQGMTEPEAIRLGRRLEEFDLTWFEEPLPAHDVEGLARVAAALDTPIASGETDYTRYAFRRMLELRTADVLMPDLQRVGGVTEFMRVGHLADAYDIPISSHLFSEQSVSVLGALGNGQYLEWMPWFTELYRERLDFADGFAIVPERPGFGFTFDQERVAHLEGRS